MLRHRPVPADDHGRPPVAQQGVHHEAGLPGEKSGVKGLGRLEDVHEVVGNAALA